MCRLFVSRECDLETDLSFPLRDPDLDAERFRLREVDLLLRELDRCFLRGEVESGDLAFLCFVLEADRLLRFLLTSRD